MRFNMRPLEAYQPEDLKVASDRQSRPCSVFSALSPPFVGSGYIVVESMAPRRKIRFVPEPGPAGVLRKVLPPYALCAGPSRVCPVVMSQLESARAVPELPLRIAIAGDRAAVRKNAVGTKKICAYMVLAVISAIMFFLAFTLKKNDPHSGQHVQTE